MLFMSVVIAQRDYSVCFLVVVVVVVVVLFKALSFKTALYYWSKVCQVMAGPT